MRGSVSWLSIILTQAELPRRFYYFMAVFIQIFGILRFPHSLHISDALHIFLEKIALMHWLRLREDSFQRLHWVLTAEFNKQLKITPKDLTQFFFVNKQTNLNQGWQLKKKN